MLKTIFKGNKFFFIILILNYCSIANSDYKQIDSSLPLYIETNDICERWVPALFSSLSTINTIIKENYKNERWDIVINNPFLIISKLRNIHIYLISGSVSVFARNHP